jgi:predicted RNA-binding protein associated with RNAse of E/G family
VCTMERGVGEIRSGSFADPAVVSDYRAEAIGDVLVERVIWGEGASEQRYGRVLAAPGFIWFRFWLPRLEQIVERYYFPDGQLIGSQIDVCMPVLCDESGCRARDLILDLWLDPDGRVTLHNEEAFEEAAREGSLSPDEVKHAELHLRVLTAGIAQTRFPPPLVRNWQIDQRRVVPLGGLTQPATDRG